MPPSSVSVVIQHHPRRAHLLDALLAGLGPCTVIPDPEPDGPPSAIRTYLACLRAMPEDASHLLVVQDDVRPCPDFARRARAAIDERPDDMVALFLAGAPHRSALLARQAFAEGRHWTLAHPRDWTPTVALAWPRRRRDEFLPWIEQKPKLVRVGDDNVVGEFVRRFSIPVWVTVPSLVEHPDVEASLIGRRASGGQNRMRVAAVPPAAL